MASLSSKIVVNANGTFSAALEFNLQVIEYLKGKGPSTIVATWVDGVDHSTRGEANYRKTVVLANRDDQWDDREAIIFLHDYEDGPTGLGTEVVEQLKRADHFSLGSGHPYGIDDYYSLHSERDKAWLPASSSSSTGQGLSLAGDDREFLQEVPSSSRGASTNSATSTITLGDVKKRIADVAAEYDAGDGSEAYEKCLKDKYESERHLSFLRELKNDPTFTYDQSDIYSALKSGQPAHSILYQRTNVGLYPSQKAKTWLEGRDAALFTVVQGEPTPFDVDGDGKLTAGTDGIRFAETFSTVRPLPAGEYSIDRMEVWLPFLLCDYAFRNKWPITVTAPSGTLHEMFFDPVTVGAAVAADATSGVLKPRTFKGTSGASATIDRIAYEPAAEGSGQSGFLRIEVAPDDALSGKVVDFIVLDGTVSLTLSVAAATLDAAAGTLSWPVASQPWKAGDELMVRVRPAAP